MPDQKLISPLLDGFAMGDPISDHDGVRCCPAMRENSDDKYIVKIISVPPSQKQLDALLLTGAYPDAASAMDYFKELAEGVVKEAEILKQLAKLQGFLPYENWQVVPMEDNRLGYEIYLMSPYKRSLEKHLRSNTMTHLGAVNLGLDLCAALSICRRAGYMYVDLKPSNIFLTGDREYRIGDLGFASLNSMKFNSLPSKYCSPYTAHELHDPLATLNPTADIYSVGMILYQIYNDGKLPFEGKAPSTVLPTPMNADYEMAEIIQKAIDPNPRKRWQTPIEMGQALVSYMQRNSVNDVPIVPPTVQHDVAGDREDEAEDTRTASETHEELAFLNDMTSDETAPDASDEDVRMEGAMSEEVNSMLAQADELISMELPDAVVVPEIGQIPIPEPAPAEPEDTKEPAAPAAETESPIAQMLKADSSPERKDTFDEDDDEVSLNVDPQKKRSWISIAVLIIVAALLCAGGLYFYNNYYLLPVEYMEINGEEDTISVFVQTDIDETLLTVVCTDTYGNTSTMPLVNGQAEFIGLNPATTYKITVEVEGFHALTGAEPCSYTTAEQTKIADFTAKTGTEDGSVVLNFAIEGRETQDWMIEYSAEDEEARAVSFTGHMVAISGLTVGKTYTFTLIAPAEDLWIVGDPTIEYTASQIVVAENLAITACSGDTLTAEWAVPEGVSVDSWTVRCYAEGGFDETLITSETNAEFRGIDPTYAYTVEVTAAGMTQNTRAYITANPATITHKTVVHSEDGNALNVSWEFEGIAPQGGWLLLYSIDGSENGVVTCAEASAVISPRIPGATYNLTIQAADGSTVFQGQHSYTATESDPFDQLSVKAETVSASLCPTPSKENWNYKDVDKDDYTSKYNAGDKVSIVIYSEKQPDYSDDDFHVLFVIRDSEGNILMDLVKDTTMNWVDLWRHRTKYCTLDIPAIPVNPGKYTLEIYFNGALLVEKNLTIKE